MAWSAGIAGLRGCPVVAAAVALTVAGCAGTDSVEDRRRSDTRVNLAKEYLGERELRPATAEAERALQYDPDNEEAHNILGLVSLSRAVSHARLLEIESCITGVDAESLRAEKDDFLLDAADHFRRAVTVDERYGEGWSNMGTVALNLGDYEEAIGYFERALAHPIRLGDPALTRTNLGWAHAKLESYVEAVTELRQAVQFQPDMCLANYRLGRVYFEREEFGSAASRLEGVVADPECTIQEAHLYYMKARRELGGADGIRDAGRACVDLAPDSCTAARCRALTP